MLAKWNDFGLAGMEKTFSVLDDLRREMDRIFEDFEYGLGSGVGSGLRMDLLDTGSALLVKAEVPGVEEKDLEVSVDQGTVTIRAKRKDSAPEGYSVHRKERGAFSLSRTFTLPCKVESEKVTASLKNGVLELNLPKCAESQPRQIEVSAG